MIIPGLIDPGSPLRAMSRAIASFTLVKWLTSKTSAQHTIDIYRPFLQLTTCHEPWMWPVIIKTPFMKSFCANTFYYTCVDFVSFLKIRIILFLFSTPTVILTMLSKKKKKKKMPKWAVFLHFFLVENIQNYSILYWKF